jgi:hypothetical protein
MQMSRAPAARGARNKECYFWTPLCVFTIYMYQTTFQGQWIKEAGMKIGET